MQEERNNLWLKEHLQYIWQTYFADVDIPEKLIVRFGQNAYTRLGSISPIKSAIIGRKRVNFGTKITITGYFKNPSVPQEVVDAVLGHEICHYVHGYFSELPKAARFPHKGGLVDKEMVARGMGETLRIEKKWIKTNWKEHLYSSHPELARPERGRRVSGSLRRRVYRRRRPKGLFDILFG